MKKNQYLFIFLGLFVLLVQNATAQQDSLLLFTKPGCSNCQATKTALHQYGINFIEKNLENNENATIMLRKLSVAGYKNKIFLPVIFLNNKLYHPAFRTDTGLVELAISDVVDSLKLKFRRGELHLAISKKQQVVAKNEQEQLTSDCELKTNPLYLICTSYNSENEAIIAMKKLIANGYPYAGIVLFQNQYRVYSKFFLDHSVANSDLIEARKIFNNAYLLELP
ncbi:MAG: glutaredoxin [Paludibacter sp.]